jgi:hypothetical protein
MADIGRSSFIPKETVGLTPSKIRRKRTFHVFGFLATTMLVGSLALAGGVYFLKSSAEKNLSAAKQLLTDQKSLFKSEDILEVRAFDRRLQVAEVLIQNHVAPLKIFAALEKETKQSIQFTKFSLEHTPTREMLLSLDGLTPEFKSLALQELQFDQNKILRDVAFNQVAINEAEEGGTERMVAFTLKGSVDLGNVRYDGTSVFIPEPVAFEETNAILTVEDGAPIVLGETVTNEEI